MGDFDSIVDGIRETLPFSSLEDLLTAPDGFGLVTASNLQRAICRVIDPHPLAELWEDEEVQKAFGGVHPPLPKEMMLRILLILSGIRSGKTLIVAAATVWATQALDLSTPLMKTMMKPGDIPRVSIVSLGTDVSKPAFNHIVNSMRASRRLRRMWVSEPTADSVTLRHPTGREIEIKVVAGARAGGTLVSRWSAGVIFDEAPRMVGEEEGVINLDHALAATKFRMLPGCLIFMIGSPFQPFGPVYDMFTEYFGAPDKGIVVIKAPAPSMNPVLWTPSVIAKAREDDPQTARTDIDADFQDPETTLFSSVSIASHTRAEPAVLPPNPLHEYSAGMDPATRGNSWTLVVGTKDENEVAKVALAVQWTGSKVDPLSPKTVMREVAEYLKPYNCYSIATDQWSSDAIRDFGHDVGLSVYVDNVSPAETVRRYSALAQRLDAGFIELPPNRVFLNDLNGVKKRASRGGVTIVLPRTSDSRHGDYAPSFMLAFSRYLAAPMPEPPEDECYDDEDEEVWEMDSRERDEDEEYSPEFAEQGAGW